MERQPRERPVPCQWCRTPTWNIDAVCDAHEKKTTTHRPSTEKDSK